MKNVALFKKKQLKFSHSITLHLKNTSALHVIFHSLCVVSDKKWPSMCDSGVALSLHTKKTLICI